MEAAGLSLSATFRRMADPRVPALSRRAFLAAGLGAASTAALPRFAGAAPPARLFGHAEIRLAHSASVTAWRAVLARHADQEVNDYGSCPEHLRMLASSCGARRWNELLATRFPAGGLDLLAAVNERINREPSMPDAVLWREMDHWATPREFLALGGDCEDFAISKLLLLRRAGWPEDLLRLVVVQRGQDGQYHAVAAARWGERVYVLDNLRADLRPDTYCPDYRPLYAVSETGLYLYRGEALP